MARRKRAPVPAGSSVYDVNVSVFHLERLDDYLLASDLILGVSLTPLVPVVSPIPSVNPSR